MLGQPPPSATAATVLARSSSRTRAAPRLPSPASWAAWPPTPSSAAPPCCRTGAPGPRWRFPWPSSTRSSEISMGWLSSPDCWPRRRGCCAIEPGRRTPRSACRRPAGQFGHAEWPMTDAGRAPRRRPDSQPAEGSRLPRLGGQRFGDAARQARRASARTTRHRRPVSRPALRAISLVTCALAGQAGRCVPGRPRTLDHRERVPYRKCSQPRWSRSTCPASVVGSGPATTCGRGRQQRCPRYIMYPGAGLRPAASWPGSESGPRG